MYTEKFKEKVLKKWIDSGKTARLTENESRALAEIQTNEQKRLNLLREHKARPRPKNEVKIFHNLIKNLTDY